MATFVHITSGTMAERLRRGGIRPAKRRHRELRGVFAMPVTPNFQVTHQWLRELQKWRRGPAVGVYFRIPDAEIVSVGRYNTPHETMTAAEALAHVRSLTTMTGVEVLIPRAIHPKEIVRSRTLPQLIGWRHYPGAHGHRPWSCDCCQQGEFGSRRIREKAAAAQNRRSEPTR